MYVARTGCGISGAKTAAPTHPTTTGKQRRHARTLNHNCGTIGGSRGLGSLLHLRASALLGTRHVDAMCVAGFLKGLFRTLILKRQLSFSGNQARTDFVRNIVASTLPALHAGLILFGQRLLFVDLLGFKAKIIEREEGARARAG